MRKKSEIELLLEQELKKQEKEERANRLLSNYVSAQYEKKHYLQEVCKGAIWGAIIGVLLLIGLAFAGLDIREWDILSISTFMVVVAWVFAGFIPVAKEVEFHGLITGLIGFAFILTFSFIILPIMLLYRILKVIITRNILTKDYKKHPEYYVENSII